MVRRIWPIATEKRDTGTSRATSKINKSMCMLIFLNSLKNNFKQFFRNNLWGTSCPMPRQLTLGYPKVLSDERPPCIDRHPPHSLSLPSTLSVGFTAVLLSAWLLLTSTPMLTMATNRAPVEMESAPPTPSCLMERKTDTTSAFRGIP